MREVARWLLATASAVSFFACAADSVWAAEADATAEAMSVGEIFGAFGYSADPGAIDAKTCNLALNLDQKTFVPKIPDLQKMGLLNDELTQAKINSEPNTLSLAFIVQVMPVAVEQIYKEHKNADRCHFTQYLTIVDDYGNDKKLLAASFDFTRALFARINWTKFESAKLVRIAPNFRFAPAVTGLVGAEQ